MKQVTIAAIAVCLTLGLAGSAQAIYIDFSGYTTGDLAGQGGWTDGNGVNGATLESWTFDDGGNDGSAVVVDGDLGTDAVGNPPPGSQSTANPYVTVTNGTGGNWGTSAQLAVDWVEGASEDGYWLAATMDLPAPLAGWAGVETHASGGDPVVYLGHAYNRTVYSVGGYGGEFYSNVAILDENDESTPTLLVYQYEGSDTGAAHLWVNPDLTQPAPAPDASDPDSDAGDQRGISNIRIRLGNAPGGTHPTMHIDNIYLGVDTPFAPEPATMALLGLGGLGVLARRKRR